MVDLNEQCAWLAHQTSTLNWYTKLANRFGTPNLHTKLTYLTGIPNWHTKLAHQTGIPNWHTKLAHQIVIPNWHTKLEHQTGTPNWNTKLIYKTGILNWHQTGKCIKYYYIWPAPVHKTSWLHVPMCYKRLNDLQEFLVSNLQGKFNQAIQYWISKETNVIAWKVVATVAIAWPK